MVQLPQSVRDMIAKLVSFDTTSHLSNLPLIEFVRAKKVPEFICGLAKLANIDIPTAKFAILNKSHEGLAIVCRALDFDRSTFSTFVLEINGSKTQAMDDTYSVLRSYDRLTAETAQRILRFWRVRKKAAQKTGGEPGNLAAGAVRPG